MHDDRGPVFDTLFGRFRVKSPRIRRCSCHSAGTATEGPQSLFSGLVPDRATPGLLRLQAELGSRHSFREAARLFEMFLPCSAQLNTTVRNRSGRIADELGFNEVGQGDTDTDAASSPITVFLDGTHVQCWPENQKRHLDVVVGNVESRNTSRRFVLVQHAAASPARQLRNGLIAKGWDGQSPVSGALHLPFQQLRRSSELCSQVPKTASQFYRPGQKAVSMKATTLTRENAAE